MDGGAVIILTGPIRRPEPEHRGQRRHPEIGQLGARKQRHTRGHHRFRARRQHEFVSARDRFAVQQRLNGDGAGDRIGVVDPELAEDREFLARGAAGADGQTARRQPVTVAAPEDAEIGRALEHRQLVQNVGLVQRAADAETRPAHLVRGGLRGLGREMRRVEIEDRRVEGQGLRHAVAHDIDAHGFIENHPRRQQVQPEARNIFPRIGVPLEPDRAILVVVDILERPT